MKRPTNYFRIIIRLRYLSAILIGLAGFGFVITSILLWEAGLLPCMILLCAGGAIFIALVLEQMFAAWIHSARGRVSLLSLMLLISGACLFLAIERLSLGIALLGLLVALVFISSWCEEKRGVVFEQGSQHNVMENGDE